MEVTAIFDIGKTNKKFFLFDTHHRQVYKEYIQFDEIQDEDGFPCDDLMSIRKWMHDCLDRALKQEKYDVRSLNFSGYGASLVHIDQQGEPVTPIYNYLKPIPEEILASFYRKYGDELTISKQTASPPLGMLNSGLQLYWLKQARPDQFKKIAWSLHFPQYLSYLFTGIPLSEYTSIGCHTFLWDYVHQRYHDWVFEEQLDRIFPPIVNTHTRINLHVKDYKLRVGVGIHDSSSALIPYLRGDHKPFLLISTGTWSICMNPFNQDILTEEDLKKDCLNFMQTDGASVKASRLFLGNEYNIQIEILRNHFEKPSGYHKAVSYNPVIHKKLEDDYQHYFHMESIALERDQPQHTNLSAFETYEEAYHQLMMELVALQVEVAERAIGETPIAKIYVDGGFADNDIYIQLLGKHFSDVKLRTTQSPLGSALGASIMISNKEVGKEFLKENYSLIKHNKQKFAN